MLFYATSDRGFQPNRETSKKGTMAGMPHCVRTLQPAFSPRSFRPGLVSLLVLFLLTFPVVGKAQGVATTEAEAEPALEEVWYRVDLGGQPAGRMMTRETRLGDTLTTESALELVVRRGSAELRLEMASRFVEGLDGTPRRAWSRQLLGPNPVETDYEFTASEIVVTTRHGSSREQQRQKMPEVAWLTPGQTDAALRRFLAAGEERFVLRTVDPLVGMSPIEIEWQLAERDAHVTLDEGPVATSRWHQSQSIAPQMVSLVDLDAEGEMVRSEVPLMGMAMVLTRVARDAVQTLGQAPEVLVSTLLHPDRAIPQPRRLRRARYELWIEGGTLDPLPSTGYQRVEAAGPAEDGSPEPSVERLQLILDLDALPAPLAEGEKAATYLERSTFLDHDHPLIGQLLAKALGKDTETAKTEPSQRAETLRQFVSRYLHDKDLETALATASEAAESRSGDCTEHSVLLSALLRAAGIPSRVVSGVVYIEHFAGQRQVFGYHMWSQALLDGRWVDLDPSMPTPFDATHLAFAVTALNDDQEALLELGRLAPLIGRLKLRVVELGEERR